MNVPIRGGPTVPLEPALVDEMALRAAAVHPHRLAVVDARTGGGITFRELQDRSRRFAAGLAERGAGRGDVVALVAASSPGYAQALYGALAAGAAVASANPALTAAELARQFARTKPRLVLADRWSRAAVEAALRSTGSSAALHSLDDDLADLTAARSVPAAMRDPDGLALLFPSSGTTGLPKIAAHTHRGTTAFLQAFAAVRAVSWTDADVVGLVVPFAHLYGSAILSHALCCGATVVIRNAPGFDLEAFLRMLQDHAVTVAPVTPPVLLALARSSLVERFDLSSLRLLLSSAASCPPDLQDEVVARMGCQVIDSLGSTEAWCYASPADPPVRGSVGTGFPRKSRRRWRRQAAGDRVTE
jgi:acyl-CoA synthetase (AMP-forming)/AMP-acid ligase II